MLPPAGLAFAAAFAVLFAIIAFNRTSARGGFPGAFPADTDDADAPPSLPFPAYVVSLSPDKPRFQRAAMAIRALGFLRISTVAPRRHALGDKDGPNRVAHRACSNKGGHKRAWEKFVSDYKDAKGDPWAFFFEDDVDVHPAFASSPLPARRAVLDAVSALSNLSLARPGGSSGKLYSPLPPALPFVNLGLCCIVCRDYDRDERFVPGTLVEVARTCGRCVHAYGMPLSLARELWSLFDSGHDEGCRLSAAGKEFPEGQGPEWSFLDFALQEVLCSRVGGLSVVGRNIPSPQDGGHVGIVFQDRARSPSIVEDPKGGVG
ncbi:hypothetical protein DFJ74DRAFT_704505 [Hyaloraphidium curvatum]|nr:hypothetical protein DFJ74DRAFT_704505 [Hyaloraphidium curvatum]